ncbi:hypothetical protein Q5P01_025095 [Channa striata]|uniref:Uncharacterized protein n=1 Tax=Channa striata TaxID=64152 RepID=A0AA88J4X6_CHASR|nr:hypothetical protein Q5P01_025095 [Channa striata]
MDMDSARSPPPLPPSSSRGKKTPKPPPAPIPQHAAIPFYSNSDNQGTNDSDAAQQNAEAPLVENLPPPIPSDEEEESPSDEAEKCSPVQETAPAPQALHAPQIPAQEDEQTTQDNLQGIVQAGFPVAGLRDTA